MARPHVSPVVLALLLGALTPSAPARAVSALWIGATNGDWTEPARWTTNPVFPNNGTPPGATYDATIDATGASYVVTLGASIGLDSLLVDSPDAQLRHTAGTLGVPNAEVRRGSFVLNGGAVGPGHWTIGSGGAWAALVGVNQGGVTFDVASGGVIGVGGNNTQLRFNTNTVVNLAGRIDDGLAGVAGSGRIRNQGRIVVDGGSADFDAFRLINDPTGRIEVLNGGDFDLDEVTWTNDGLIEIADGSMILGSQGIQPVVTVLGINNGTARVNDGFLSIGVENHGVIEATNSTLDLYLLQPNAGTLELENVDLRPQMFAWSELGTLNWSGTNNRTTLRFSTPIDVPSIVFDASSGDLWMDGGFILQDDTVPPGVQPTLTFLDGKKLHFTSNGGSVSGVDVVGDVDLPPNARGELNVRLTGRADLGRNARLDISDLVAGSDATLNAGRDAWIYDAGGALTLGSSLEVHLAGGRLLGRERPAVNVCFPSCFGELRNRGLVHVADAVSSSEIWALEFLINEAEGTIQVDPGAELALDFGATGRNAGLISLGAGSTTTVTEDPNPAHVGSRFVNEGTIALDGATLVLADALNQRVNLGILQGNGSIHGDLQQDGILAPGASPGLLEFDGDLVFGSTARLEIELGGFAASERDRVDVQGDVTLGGVLAVSFLDGFEDVVEGSFVVLDGLSALGGAFANVASGGLLTSEGGERSFQVFYGAGSPYAADDVVLVFSAPVPEPGLALLLIPPLAALARSRARSGRTAARIAT